MKNKKYNTVGTISKSNIKPEGDKIDTPNIQIHDHLITFLAWHRYFNKKWQGYVKLVLLAQTTPLSEMMWSCKYFLHVSNISTLTQLSDFC
jgi:hypothetical protein